MGKFKNNFCNKTPFMQSKNEEIGSKYNVAAWEHFGKTNKLHNVGVGFDGEEVQGTLKINRNRKNPKVKFKEKGKLKKTLLSNKLDMSGI